MNATKDVLRAFPQQPISYTLSRAVADDGAVVEYTFGLQQYVWPLLADVAIGVDFDDATQHPEIVLWLKAIFATTVLRLTTADGSAVFPSATPYVF